MRPPSWKVLLKGTSLLETSLSYKNLNGNQILKEFRKHITNEN